MYVLYIYNTMFYIYIKHGRHVKLWAARTGPELLNTMNLLYA